MRKILIKEIKEKYLVVGVVFLMIILFIPILMLARYMVPSADDYSYGLEPHLVYMSTGSVFETIKSAYTTMLVKWYTWQGTFSSIFLMCLTPAVFSDEIYGITTLLLVGVLTVSIFFMFKVIFKELLGVEDRSWFVGGGLVSIFCIETLLSKVEALYWYNSGIHYTFMTAIMFISLSLVVRMIIERKRGRRIVAVIFACLTAFITSGSNYITTLLGSILLVTIVVIGMLYKRKTVVYAIFPLVCYAIGFYINASAPGNAVRQLSFEKLSVIDAVFQSFKAAFQYSLDWASKFTLVFLVLLLPVLWNHAKRSNYNFRFPLLVPLYSFCLIASSFAPSLYSMGTVGGGRNLNVSKIIFQLCLIVCEWYLCGYINRILEKKRKIIEIKHTVFYYAIVGLILLIVFFSEAKVGRIQNYATYGAYHYLSIGEAERYHAEYEMRLPYFKLGDKNVVLDKYTVRPTYLYFDDITTNSDDWRNRGMAAWYGVDSVVLREGY